MRQRVAGIGGALALVLCGAFAPVANAANENGRVHKAAPGRALTGPSELAPGMIVAGYLNQRGTAGSAVANLVVTGESRGKSGHTHLRMEQRLEGKRIMGSEIKANLDAEGRVTPHHRKSSCHDRRKNQSLHRERGGERSCTESSAWKCSPRFFPRPDGGRGLGSRIGQRYEGGFPGRKLDTEREYAPPRTGRWQWSSAECAAPNQHRFLQRFRHRPGQEHPKYGGRTWQRQLRVPHRLAVQREPSGHRTSTGTMSTPTWTPATATPRTAGETPSRMATSLLAPTSPSSPQRPRIRP